MKKLTLITAAFLCLLLFTLHVPAQESILRGDTDRDGELTILDATKIQRVIAEMDAVSDPLFSTIADTDGDESVTILDATRLERTLAELCNIDGSVPFDSAFPPQYIETASQAPTEDPTDSPAFSLEAPVIRFESSGLTVNFDGDLSYYALYEWSAVDGADAYEVYYKTKSENKWHLLCTLNAADHYPAYDFSGAAGESYRFTVRAVAHIGSEIYRSPFIATAWQDAFLDTPVCTGAYFMPKWIIQDGNYTPVEDDRSLNFQWEPITQFTRPNINYRVYIREDGVWRKLNDNGQVSYCIYDTGEGGGNYGVYEFAVRIMTSDKKTFVSEPGIFRITYSPEGLTYENITG